MKAQEIIKLAVQKVNLQLKAKKKIDTTKMIYKILESELENYIHSIQLSIN